jgi:8-oxo-dGTP pyrophosphatase MutT (NUDIX family)
MSEISRFASHIPNSDELAGIRTYVADGSSDKQFPERQDRLFAGMPGVEIDVEARRVVLPRERNGEKAPWHIQDHSNRAGHALNNEILWRPTAPVPAAVSARYHRLGFWLDQYDEAVPRAAIEMLTDPDIGALTGMGSAWDKPFNWSGDFVVALREAPEEDWQIPMTKRQDGTRYDGTWGFPGGWRQTDESLLQAARREFSEEMGIPEDALGGPGDAEELRKGLLIGAAATAHTMSINGLYIYILQGDAAKAFRDRPLQASSESYAVGLKTLSELGQLAVAPNIEGTERLFPYHRENLTAVQDRLTQVR